MVSTSETEPRFDPFAREVLADPYPALSKLREECPVFYEPDLDMWVLTRYDHIDEVLRDTRRFSSATAQAPFYPLTPEAREILASGFRPVPSLLSSDPPDHTRMRHNNNRVFSPRRLEQMEPAIRGFARQLIEALLPNGRADIATEFAFPLPALTIFRFIGFPDQDATLLKGWCSHRVLFSFGRPSPEIQAEVARGMVAYWGYLERFVAGRLEHLADDYASDLLRIHLADPAVLSVPEITSILFGFSFAGHETVTKTIRSSLRYLITRRDLWDDLCVDSSLIPAAIEEVLRFDGSVISARRTAKEPVTIGGVDIPQGATLLCVTAAANHDPRVFPEPDVLNPDRPNLAAHLAFGKGIHYCIGAPLARLQTKIALEEVATHMPSARLVPDQEFDYVPSITVRGPQHLLLEWDF